MHMVWRLFAGVGRRQNYRYPPVFKSLHYTIFLTKDLHQSTFLPTKRNLKNSVMFMKKGQKMKTVLGFCIAVSPYNRGSARSE